MSKLWNGVSPINYICPPEIRRAEYTRVLDCVAEYGDRDFVHGIAIELYRGAIFATWAFNAQRENVKGEQCLGKISRDGGKTWGEDFEIKVHDKTRSASHGALWAHGGRLYAFVPAAEFYETSDWTKWDVDCELFVYDDGKNAFEYVATCAENFWPLSHPEVCENGNIVMAGLQKGRACIAVCDGDIKKWRTVAPERESEDASFSESAQFTVKNRVTLISRNDNVLSEDTLGGVEAGRYRLAAAVSVDGGKTFTKSEQSDIFASPSKPFAGVLADGRPYLIFDQCMDYNNARRRLLLAIGKAEDTGFEKLYTLDTRYGALSYPYAVTDGEKLYIAYSSSIGPKVDGNKNNLKIAVIDVKDL